MGRGSNRSTRKMRRRKGQQKKKARLHNKIVAGTKTKS